MNIVVLDGYTLNPGDLSWSALEQLGSCKIFDRSATDEVVPRALAAEVVLTNKTVLTGLQINALPQLRYIGVLATGFNIVDVAAARARNIPVTNVPAYGTHSVAQMTFALLLELTQRVGPHSEGVHAGRWSQCPDFSYWDFPLVELEGLTFGIVGFGRIGQAVARLAAAFGMKLLATTGHPPAATDPPVEFVALDDLFARADVVSLHCPLTEKTARLVNQHRLAMMKPSAFLINTSRGPLIDEAALAEALNNGRIAGAGLDVLSAEPPPADHPLFRARNCYITPHISWATKSARGRLLQQAIENVKGYVAGQLVHVVN